jgi:pimeloyl-ACP methyl ester carboxylesterase
MQMQELTAGHGVLKAVQTGQGRDIVVLHSLLTDRHAFDPVLPTLAAKHRVTLFNLPGFQGSEPVVTALLDAYVARIEDGFQEFEIDKDAVLIGNGFGGALALAFALDHPERIGKLVLSGAAAAFPDEGRQAFAGMAQKAAAGGLGAIAEMAAARVHSPDYLAAHPELVEQRRRALLGIDVKAFIDACKVLREIDLTPLLHRLDVPTLVVCGEADQATPPALTKEVAGKIPGARYVELKNCGHCPPLEQPQQFAAAVMEFVGS